MCNRLAWLVVILLLARPCGAAALTAEGFELENGMRVQVISSHRAPVVTHMLWLKAGGADDPPGYSGVAHYLEHMMFKGTRHVPDGQYTKRVEKLGGEHNAFTGTDFTAYYVTIAKEHLPAVMALEADRMQHLRPTGFASERDVVIEERRSRVDNDPGAVLGEKMTARLFGDHPYGRPIIGWKEEVSALTEHSVMEYYRTHYHPDAAVLVLVGDITLQEAKALAQEHYGSWRPASVPSRAWPAYTPLSAAQEIVLAHPEVRQSEWMRHYPAPSLGWGDKSHVFALMLLSDLLGGGRTGALYSRLVVERGLAVEAGASYSPFAWGPSAFGVFLVPAKGVEAAALAKAYEEEIAKFMARDIPAHDLERVKNSLKAAAIYLRDGLQSQAFVLGQLLMLGRDAAFFDAWTKNIDAVTPEDIKAAARAVLVEQRAVTGVLLPGAAEKKP